MTNKQTLTILGILFLITNILSANTDRALYIKKYSNETKTALVIGNSNYNNNSLSKLKNPVNDARAVRDKLKSKNFEVLYIEDATQRELDKIVSRFGKKLKNSGVGLFYFAGHGLEVDKKNYLIPIGANVSDEDDVKYESLAVNKIVDKMKRSGTRLNLVILDACRNNPFKRGAGGLAPMQNAKGTLIAYATDSGSTASDNVNEKNGLFTKHFLKALDDPINQREFFHKIRKSVYDASNGKQLPYLNDGTIGDFFFTVSDTIYEKSKVSFKNVAPTKFSLTVNTTPYNAKVQITNIVPKYYDGMKLKKGKYNIKVSKNGYITKEGYVDLKGYLSLDIELEKEEVVYIKPKQTYPSNSKDIWRDKDTGLVWQVPIDTKKQDLNWINAKRYCQNLSLAGYSDWRLPNEKELLSIVTRLPYKHSTSSDIVSYIKKPLLKSIDMENQLFWSSSKKVGKIAGHAWSVRFNYGNSDDYSMYSSKYVRCVR